MSTHDHTLIEKQCIHNTRKKFPNYVLMAIFVLYLLFGLEFVTSHLTTSVLHTRFVR